MAPKSNRRLNWSSGTTARRFPPNVVGFRQHEQAIVIKAGRSYLPVDESGSHIKGKGWVSFKQDTPAVSFHTTQWQRIIEVKDGEYKGFYDAENQIGD
jgi:hypothetical protein